MKIKNLPSISIFIPIRKNSKRIKNKNIKPLPGLKFGLTELKIKQLKKLKIIFEKNYKTKLDFVVSTDCQIVLKYVKRFKWIQAFKRNKNLATDDSLNKLIKYVPTICKNDFILWTHVTSPLFNENDYINFLKTFFEIRKKGRKTPAKSAFSADIIQKFIIDEKGRWISHNYKKKKWPKTQEIKKFFLVNSAAFIATRETYLKESDRLCKKPMPISSRLGSGFDIDNIEDFKVLKNADFI